MHLAVMTSTQNVMQHFDLACGTMLFVCLVVSINSCPDDIK